jgi:hypothetical protein
MKTAVEWFVEEIKFHAELRQIFKGRVSFIIGESKIDELLKQAKEMEKEQIMDAFNDGVNDECIGGSKTPEQYYKETFKSK